MAYEATDWYESGHRSILEDCNNPGKENGGGGQAKNGLTPIIAPAW